METPIQYTLALELDAPVTHQEEELRVISLRVSSNWTVMALKNAIGAKFGLEPAQQRCDLQRVCKPNLLLLLTHPYIWQDCNLMAHKR